MIINNRVGEINYNNFGSKMEIIIYKNSFNISVYFEKYNWIAENVRYDQFKDGRLTCPYEPRTYGVGYMGEGIFKTREGNKKTRQYNIWNDMLERCYNPYAINKKPTYKDVIVDKNFLNFQNFCIWDKDNYYEIPNETMHLDKDILCRAYNLDNKIYSSNTCIYVPRRINNLFIKRDNGRGEYPLGVTWNKKERKFRSQCNDINGRSVTLGRFNNPIDAFNCYKIFKENIIKNMAYEYYSKGLIPQKLYDAMLLWEVKIDD